MYRNIKMLFDNFDLKLHIYILKKITFKKNGRHDFLRFKIGFFL